MSSKTQLATNNAKLSELITELQGKAEGGGSGVEKCMVGFEITNEHATMFVYGTYGEIKDGYMATGGQIYPSNGPVGLEIAKCSFLVIEVSYEGDHFQTFVCEGGAQPFASWALNPDLEGGSQELWVFQVWDDAWITLAEDT